MQISQNFRRHTKIQTPKHKIPCVCKQIYFIERQKRLSLHKMKTTIALLTATLLVVACQEGKKVEFDRRPVVQLLSVSPQTLVALRDTLNIVVKYTDGDGDLGHAHPDSNSIFATDLRNGVVHKFRLQPLTPEGQSELPITGNLRILIGGIPNLSGQSEKTTFEVFLKDRAGNESNRIPTPEITVLP